MLKHISFFYIHSHPTKKTEHIYSLNKKKERKENVPHTHTTLEREIHTKFFIFYVMYSKIAENSKVCQYMWLALTVHNKN